MTFSRTFRGKWMQLMAIVLCGGNLASQVPAPTPRPRQFTFRALSELVLVNVTVRDRKGNLVRGLTASDFTVLEDGKPQRIASFDVENTEMALPNTVQQAKVLTAESAPGTLVPQVDKNAVKDRRLVV